MLPRFAPVWVAGTLLAIGPTAPALALDLPIPVDKAAHFGVSYVVTDQLMRAGMRPEQAVGVTLFGGWLKEVLDRQFDPTDLAADAAGALAAAYLRVEFKF
ncbi:MAG: hypothetical protein ACK46X_14780 [Candidatus Sericytochromatia bacterium]